MDLKKRRNLYEYTKTFHEEVEWNTHGGEDLKVGSEVIWSRDHVWHALLSTDLSVIMTNYLQPFVALHFKSLTLWYAIQKNEVRVQVGSLSSAWGSLCFSGLDISPNWKLVCGFGVLFSSLYSGVLETLWPIWWWWDGAAQGMVTLN